MNLVVRVIAAQRARLSVGPIRLASGLTLFTYVGLHLLNHSLGNISILAMEAGLQVQKFIWQGMIGTLVLYLALTSHFSLGLWAFYARRHFGWTRAEVTQVTLGLLIPLLLMNHLFATRIALTQFGLRKGYAQELYSFWVAAPELGWLQVSVLVVAWTHGCIGVALWLRLKPFFEHAWPFLLCAAIILPLLALLGFCQGGWMIQALAHDPSWRADNLNPWQVGQPMGNAALLRERNDSLMLMLALIGLALLARLIRAVWERWGGILRVGYPDGRVARIPRGFSVLDASRSAHIPHASVCGGRARCSTCRIRVTIGAGRLPPASEREQAVLSRIGAGAQIRLACQLRPVCDIAVIPLLPPDWDAAALRKRRFPPPGEERFIAVLVADMRNSSRLAATRLPFDAVFIIDRFVNALASAVTEAGGLPAHFTGDGLMATFGLACGPEQACRQALLATGLIGRNIAALNQVMAADVADPLGFGIGVHGGPAVVGPIGFAGGQVFTALGEAANVAARLESLCKDFNCEAVISQEVFTRGGHAPAVRADRGPSTDPAAEAHIAHAGDSSSAHAGDSSNAHAGDAVQARQVMVRGREAALAVHTIRSVVHWHHSPATTSKSAAE